MRGETHPNYVLRTGLGSEHTEDTSSASDVEDGFVFEQVRVIHDRGAVG